MELLEREGRFPELATELGTLVAQAQGTERAALLARLGEVRLRLDDVARALSAFKESLETDRAQPVSRRWLEVMLSEPEHAFEAAEVLEPIYLSEYRTVPHSATMLLAVLELRANKSSDLDERIAHWVALGAHFDQARLPAERQREVAARMLRRTAVEWPGGVPKWIERVLRIQDVQFRVETFLAALDQPIAEPSTLQDVAFAAGEALDSAGRSEEALACFERALATDPSSPEVIGRIDALASRVGESLEQRVARFRGAIESATEPERRAALRYALGVLLESSASDTETAMDLWKQALSEVPTLTRAHEALIAAYTKLGNDAAVERELERALAHHSGYDRRALLLRLGESLASHGERTRAIARTRELLDDASYDDPALYVLERFGEEAKDYELVRRVYERRVEVAPDRAARAHALEGLAEFANERLSDQSAALRALTTAAELVLSPPEDLAEAERLYERIVALAPSEPKAVLRLIDLCIARADWTKVREVFRATCERLGDAARPVEMLLALEPRALQAGAIAQFAAIADDLLARLDDADVPRARALLGAKARVLVQAGHLNDAADIYENLIEAFCDEEDVRAYVGLVESSPIPEWRHHKRRWLLEWRTTRAADPVLVLVHWAAVEEQEFNDVPAAIALLERAKEHDPARASTVEELARLQLSVGDAQGAFAALTQLRELGGGSNPDGVELSMAELLIDRLDRPAEARSLLESVVTKRPADATARALLLRLAGDSPVWLEACDALELAGRLEGRVEPQVLGALLDVTDARATDAAAVPGLAERRRRWYEQLLDATEGDTALLAAENAAVEFPKEEALWTALESKAVQAGDPAAALRAYERAIKRTRDATLAESLGKRLTEFADQHVGDPKALVPPLEALLEHAPATRWAFDRVKFALGNEQRWTKLFPLYDRAIAASSDEAERALLLDEAAIAARDVARDPDRAIGYWEPYFALRPADARVDLALERLYERQRKLPELISHLGKREAHLDGPDQSKLRERIAALWVDVGDAASALSILEGFPTEAGNSPQILALLERVFALAPAPDATDPSALAARETALRAAKSLKARYAAAGKTADVARVISAELPLTSAREQRVALLRELARLQNLLGNARAEFEALGALLLLEPSERAHRVRLDELALSLGARHELADLVVSAADRADNRELFARLLFEAAKILLEVSESERAVQLYNRILLECKRREDKLEAARSLEQLLLVSGRAADRVAVLERQAELEIDAEHQKAAYSKVAKVALDELGDPSRAARVYRILIDREPTERELHDGLVRALRAAERWEDLVVALEARAELEPSSPRARRDLSDVARLFAERLGDTARATRTWRDIRDRFGADSESFEALSQLLSASGQWQALAELLEAEAETARVKAPLYQRLAQVHREHTGNLRAALDASVRAEDVVAAGELIVGHPELLSDDPALALDLATKLARVGRLPDAENVLRRQLEHYGPRRAPESIGVHLRLFELLAAAGGADRAFKELLAAAERHPSSGELQAALAEAATKSGDLARAEQSYRALLLLPVAPASQLGRAEVYLRLSDLAARRGAAEAAEDHVASAFEAALGSDEEALGLERALKQRGRQDLLERAITSRLERTREPSKVLEVLADLLDASAVFGETDASLAERALRLADRAGKDLEQIQAAPAALRPLVDVYDKLGQKVRAIAALELIASRAATAEERDGYVLETAERLLAVPGRREDALSRITDLVRRDAAEGRACELLLEEGGDLEMLLAEIDEQLGLAEKREDLRRVETLTLRRARVLERTGNLSEALASYQRLAALSGQRGAALREVVRLLELQGAAPTELAAAREALLDLESGPAAAEHAARLAQVRRDQGDRAGVERALERGFAADPTRSDLRDELVQIVASAGRWAHAAELLEVAVGAVPDDGALQLRLAQAHRSAGAAERALSALDAALAAGAPEIEVRRERARVLEGAERNEEALAELQAAHEMGGGLESEILSAVQRTRVWRNAQRWAVLAADLAGERAPRAAIREMLAFWAERDPESAPVLLRLGRLASLDGDFSVGIEALRRAAKLEHGAARREVVLALARVCESAGRPEDAIVDVERALAEGGDTAELRRELGKLYAHAGARGKHARLLLDEARSSKPPARGELLLKAAELFLAEGSHEEARQALQELTDAEPERVEAVLLSARLAAATRGAAEGRASIARFVGELKKRDKRHARLYRLLADLHLQDDELAEAVAPLSQAYQLDKSDGDTAFVLGLVAYDLDKHELAANSLRGFLATKESATAPAQLSRAYFVLACIEHAKGQRTVARRMASRALEVDAGNEPARRLLGALG